MLTVIVFQSELLRILNGLNFGLFSIWILKNLNLQSTENRFQIRTDFNVEFQPIWML